jgi:hypothetical protein
MPNKFIRRPDNTIGSALHDLVVTFNYGINAEAVDTWLFVADADYEVTRVVCVPRVAGSDGSAVTADVMKASGTDAPASGATVLSAADSFDLKGTADTLQTGTLSATESARRLKANDRLGVNFTGTLTAAVGLIQVNLKRIQGANAAR